MTLRSPHDGIDIDLERSAPALRPFAEAALAAGRADRLELLRGMEASVALAMCRPGDAAPLLDAWLARDAAGAFEAAVGTCGVHLRTTLVEGRLMRVVERPERKPSNAMPPPAFWLRLRQALEGPQASARERARELALAADLEDLRLRAAVAYVVPDEPSLWAPRHLEAVRSRFSSEDRDELLLCLLGLLRHHPPGAALRAWPPPAASLRRLPPGLREAALVLVGDKRALGALREERRLQRDVEGLLERPLDVYNLALLPRIEPDARVFAFATERLAVCADTEATVLRALVTRWLLRLPDVARAAGLTPEVARRLRVDGGRDVPATVTLSSPWGARRAPVAAVPPPPPLSVGGRWADAWRAPDLAPNDAMLRAVEARLCAGVPAQLRHDAPLEAHRAVLDAWRAGAAPDEDSLAALLHGLGPSVLPLVAGWARENARLLPSIAAIDDGQLAPAWALALTSRWRMVQDAARTWLGAYPLAAAAGALALCFSAEKDERQRGCKALDWLEVRQPEAVARSIEALDEAQRGWVASLREGPVLFAKRPVLPSFVELEALPGVPTRDGAARLDDASLGTLLALAKSSDLDDARRLAVAAAPLSPEALTRLAGVVFLEWLGAGGPPKERWALELLAHFASDEWAGVLGGLSVAWAQGGFAARGQLAAEVLARMPSRAALMTLHRLSGRVRATALKSVALRLFEDAALRHGLSPEALEDVLVPDCGLPGDRRLDGGVEVDLDEALKPVLRRGGKALKTAPASWGEVAAGVWAEVKRARRQFVEAGVRLERLMVEDITLPAQHFVEVWLMNPLLARIAERVAWVAFSGEVRVLFLTGPMRTLGGAPFNMDEAMVVRPVHPLELTSEEAGVLRRALPAQAFAQLGRDVAVVEDLRAALDALTGRELSADRLIALERQGWQRGPQVGGAFYESVSRRWRGAEVTLEFTPGLSVIQSYLGGVQTVRGVRLGASEALGRVAAAELLRVLGRLTAP